MLIRRNLNSPSIKVGAAPAALVLALTCMPGSAIHAGSLTTANPSNQMSKQETSPTPHRTTRVFVDGKEVKDDNGTAQQNQSGGRRTTDVKWKDDHGSGTLNAKDVELTADSKDIKTIAKDGYLAIDETRDGVRRQLKIEPAGYGKVKHTYSVAGKAQEMDETGKAWLARILHDYLDSSR